MNVGPDVLTCPRVAGNDTDPGLRFHILSMPHHVSSSQHIQVATSCVTVNLVADDLATLRSIMRRYRQIEALRAERDREIAALVARNVPREPICDIVGLTREQIRRIANAEQERVHRCQEGGTEPTAGPADPQTPS